MDSRWYQNAVIYCLEVGTFRDGNGDGVGDFVGLREGLSYLAGLGVTCLWLLPFYPSPVRDDGYDISDYLGVHPALGDLGDFAGFMDEAQSRGIRVIIDLVVNHTSDQHPWFQAARREGKGSKYYDYYVWREDEPGDTSDQVVFPGKQSGVWTYDEVARAYYFHKFYEYQPDLNTGHPAVREEIKKIMGFWLALGIAGFRVDAVPFVVSEKGPKVGRKPRQHFEYLTEFRDYLSWKRGDAILLAEANVLPDQALDYFGPQGDRMHLILNFYVNPHLFLSIARRSPVPLARSLAKLPETALYSHWAYFLRNHDELDLSRLTDAEREECFRAFAPREEMRLYKRGIRRRLAPMFGGDLARQLLAYSLIFTLPGTPVFWYGEEIGMGEDLSLEERDSVRTPMQWNAERNAGFSRAPAERLRRPVIAEGDFDYCRVNVQSQRRNPQSLLNVLERMIRTRKEYPEFGTGRCEVLATDQPDHVYAHACEDAAGSAVAALHNFSDRTVEVTARLWTDRFDHVVFLFDERDNQPVTDGRVRVTLGPSGFCWLRLKAEPM